MTEDLPAQISALLARCGEGDRLALARLLSLLEREPAAEGFIRTQLDSTPRQERLCHWIYRRPRRWQVIADQRPATRGLPIGCQGRGAGS